MANKTCSCFCWLDIALEVFSVTVSARFSLSESPSIESFFVRGAICENFVYGTIVYDRFTVVNILRWFVFVKMGCELGKLAGRGHSDNNGKLDEVGPPAQPPPVDSRLPLTAKQKYNMLASWKGISRAMESTGVCMFVK